MDLLIYCAAFLSAGIAVTGLAVSYDQFTTHSNQQRIETLRTLGLTEVR